MMHTTLTTLLSQGVIILLPVSYTHLTLPTRSTGETLLVAVSAHVAKH